MPETTKALNAAFVASARGNWDTADALLRELVAQDDDANYAVRSSTFFCFLLSFGGW